MYTLIGDGSGPTFFSLNNLTGEIRIKAGFRNDLALQYVVSLMGIYKGSKKMNNMYFSGDFN